MRTGQMMVIPGDEPQGTSWSFGTSWSMTGVSARMLALVAAVMLAGGLMAAPQQQQAAQAAAAGVVENVEEVVQVIVRAVAGSDEAERAVERLGGTVVQRLGIIDGFVVEIAAGKVDALSHSPGVLSVTADGPIRLMAKPSVGDTSPGAATLNHIRTVVSANNSDRKGNDGSGVGVALLDTGVASVVGTEAVEHGPNVGAGSSGDGFGHGTHLAGILGARDKNSNGFWGIASDSTVVSVKAAADDGSTNLVSVLAGLDWVVQHKATRNIKVLNLSLGVPAPSHYTKDILAAAVESVWDAGIVVVVAAGNDGELPGSPLTSPATDPYVIAVGAAATNETDVLIDDTVPAFSPRGSAARRVDVVAPGKSVVSLRAPGSHAEVSHPQAHVGDRWIKGTGTSQAAAVVAGVVTSLLEGRPSLTPDQVKAVLKASATPLLAADAAGQGAGMVNLGRALNTAVPANATQTHPKADLTPTEAPSAPFIPPPPTEDGSYCEYDIKLGPPAPPADDGSGSCGWTGGTWSGGTWSGGTWSGGTWSGGTWSGGTWSGGTWSGGTWSGGTWSTSTWVGGTWSGGTWSGGTWSGGTWSGGTWSAGNWSGGTWSGGTWSGGTWSGGTWSGGTWSGGTWSGGTWSGGTWSGSSWIGGTWSGGTWSGGTWSGGTWSGGTWSGGTWSGGTWSGGTWSGGTWSGGTWSGGTWSGGTWSGGTWSGGTWSGGTWSGGTWSGGTWSGGTWSGGTWSGGTWSGGTWSGGTWSGGTWSGGTWSGGTWSGGTWSGGTWSGGNWSAEAWTGTTWS